MATRPTNLGNLETLKNMIELIDGYRAVVFTDPEKLEKQIKGMAFGGSLAREWKNIKKNLIELSSMMKDNPKLRRKLRIMTILRMGSTFYFVATLASAVFIPRFFVFLFISAFVVYLGSALYERWMRLDLKRHFDSAYREKRDVLKVDAQRLLDQLSTKLREQKADPESYPLWLYNTDYYGISVIRKPGFLAKQYRVNLVLGY